MIAETVTIGGFEYSIETDDKPIYQKWLKYIRKLQKKEVKNNE